MTRIRAITPTFFDIFPCSSTAHQQVVRLAEFESDVLPRVYIFTAIGQWVLQNFLLQQSTEWKFVITATPKKNRNCDIYFDRWFGLDVTRWFLAGLVFFSLNDFSVSVR